LACAAPGHLVSVLDLDNACSFSGLRRRAPPTRGTQARLIVSL